ncbi:MAG: hypothetical protein PVH61_36110 [Candidatus Aminicenantes bacterium]|jgi:nucleoside 2-deoxyribosyltransferase
MNSWIDIEKRFRDIAESLKNLRLDYQWGAGGEYWHLYLIGMRKNPVVSQFEELATIAGNLLNKTFDEKTELGEYLLSERDSKTRWYKALKEHSGEFEIDRNIPYLKGEPIFKGSVNSVAEVSANLCLKLHANQPIKEDRNHMPIEKNYVFIIMAMIEGDPQLIDIHETISETCKSLNLKAERVDQIEHTGRITDKIIECINKAEIVIADLTHNRPNCYYEAGYAHGIGKNVIFTAKKDTELQFDLKDYSVIFYPNMSILKKKLLKRLQAIKG